MRCLITGNQGFIGRHAQFEFSRSGYDVLGIDLCDGGIERVLPKVNCHFDVVLHCASNIESLDRRYKAKIDDAFRDVELDKFILSWLETNPPDKLIWMSSCVVLYPDGQDAYSAVKSVGQSMALHYYRTANVPTFILQPFSGYGEDQSVSYPFTAIADRALRYENPLTVWSDSVRDWIHVDDITRYILAAAEQRLPVGVPIPIGTGRPMSFTQLAKMFSQCVGYSPEIAIAGDKPQGHPYRVLQSEPIIKPLISLEEGIRRTVAARSHALNEV